MSRAAELLRLARQRRVCIAVVGDIMRDEYVRGTVERISQEAAIPILRTEGESAVFPGGAGNVARQLAHWNVDVKLVGLVDHATSTVLDHHEISTRHCVPLLTGVNPVKKRFYAGKQTLLRHDIEQVNYGDPDILERRDRLTANLQSLLTAGVDAVIFSDYAKGAFDESGLRQMLGACRQIGAPTLVDPHIVSAPEQYGGCTILKPNAAFERVYSTSRLQTFSREHQTGVVITQGSAPPHGFQAGEPFSCSAYQPVRVDSVVGAGDCFAAHLALCMVHRLPIRKAATLADGASRLYVQRADALPVTPYELTSFCDGAGAKLIDIRDLQSLLRTRRPQGPLVFANGCFDLLHAGHLHTLRWAKDQGDVLVVGINDDAGVARLKGRGRPLVPFENRVEALSGLSCVDWIVPFSEDTPESLLRLLRPDIMVKGPDYIDKTIVCADLVPQVCVAPPSCFPYHSSDFVQKR